MSGDPGHHLPMRPAGALRALLLALLVLAPGLPGASPVRAIAPPAPAGPELAPLPPCRYLDEMTRFREPSDWARTMLDTRLRLPRDYRAPGLVSVTRAGIAGSGKVRQLVIPDLTALARAARKAGFPLQVRSAWRSWETQEAVFAGWVRKSGYREALRYSARPGHSEHQLGTTLDLGPAAASRDPWEDGGMDRTPTGRWMRANAWRFGWVMSYPKGEEDRSCYGYEAWHWRYVGRETAAAVRESGLPLRVWLWRNSERLP